MTIDYSFTRGGMIMLICPNCRSSIPEGTKFCPECGKKLEANTSSKANHRICPFCGEVLEPDSIFCENCGRQLPVQMSASAGTAGAAGSAKKVPAPPMPPLPVSVLPPETHEPAQSRKRKSRTVPIAAALVIILMAVVAFLCRDSIGILLNPEQEISQDQNAGTVSAEKSESAADEISTPEPVDESASSQTTAETEQTMRYDPLDYQTFQQATLADFEWANMDILNGKLPDGFERITNFEEVKGGWKLYIIDGPDGQYGTAMERLCRCAFGEDEDGLGIGIRWDYVHNNATDEGYDDNTPDSFYYGTWENGTLDALGAGSVKITDFWYKDGHEYAVGTMTWPDGIPAIMFLVRP